MNDCHKNFVIELGFELSTPGSAVRSTADCILGKNDINVSEYIGQMGYLARVRHVLTTSTAFNVFSTTDILNSIVSKTT